MKDSVEEQSENAYYFRLPAACTDFTALNSINLAYSFTSRVTRNSPLEIGKCSSDA